MLHEEFKRSIEYSERSYLSKEEVLARIGPSAGDRIWERVCEYRDLFQVDVGLKNPRNLSYVLTLDRSVSARVSAVEGKSFRLSCALRRLPEREREEFRKSRDLESLEWISQAYRMNLSQKELLSSLEGRGKSGCSNEEVLANFLAASRKVDRGEGEDLGALFQRINDRLMKVDPSALVSMRQRDEPDAPTCPEELVKGALKDFFDFLESEGELPFLAKLLAGVFQYRYLSPCADFSRESGFLFFRSFLDEALFPHAWEALPLDEFFFGSNALFLRERKLAVSTGDLTYFLLSGLDLLSDRIDRSFRRVREIEGKVVETKASPEKKEENIGEPSNRSFPIAPTSPVPAAFPSPPPSSLGAPSDESDREAKHADPMDEAVTALLEKYPVLRRKVAHFYLTHKTVGSFYTIEQFRSCEGVAYETARTSMDLLANLGFYKKGKTAKKFVYAPIPKGGSL